MAIAESGSEWFRRDEGGLYLLPGTMPWDEVFDVLENEDLHPDEVVIGNGKSRLSRARPAPGNTKYVPV